mgnify:CR=1 FL=1
MQQQGLRDGFRDMMNMAGMKPSTMQSSTLVESGTGYDETEARMRELNQPFWVKFRKLITGSLNFYRVHMLYFIIVSRRQEFSPHLLILCRPLLSFPEYSTAPTPNIR